MSTMTTQTRRPAPALPARDGFAQTVRSEWTKFRSVRSTAWCLLLTVGLTVGLSIFFGSVGSTDANTVPQYVDAAQFVHQPLAGDGTVTARVASQANSHPQDKAGVMIKASTAQGAPYAAIYLTPASGVRFSADFGTEVAGSSSAAPHWLRLTRTGTTITAAESANGTGWTTVATATLPSLPSTAEVGLFVTSPGNQVTEHENAASSTTQTLPTIGRATFDSVTVQTAAGAPATGEWRNEDIGGGGYAGAPPGTVSEAGGTFTVTGSGDVSKRPPAGDDDLIQNLLVGTFFAIITVVTLGVIFGASEFKARRAIGMVRSTFAATPSRGRVVAAKAVVLGTAVFLAGLVSALGAFYLALPQWQDSGFAPPSYPAPSITDGPVLRAIVGTGLMAAVLALFGLGLGLILRRTAPAITIAIGSTVVTFLVAQFMSIDAARWINRLTPVAGLQIQSTRDRWDNWIPPWAGLGVTAAYAAASLLVAYWLLRRRDT
jgi:regulation of enolase protein 1 (concanavalin A-like superfamily)